MLGWLGVGSWGLAEGLVRWLARKKTRGMEGEAGRGGRGGEGGCSMQWLSLAVCLVGGG